jgi:hypothetical protein
MLAYADGCWQHRSELRAAQEYRQKCRLARRRAAGTTEFLLYCFTSTTVHILTQRAPQALGGGTKLGIPPGRGAQFACFTLCCSSVAALLQLCCVKDEVLSLLALLSVAALLQLCCSSVASRAMCSVCLLYSLLQLCCSSVAALLQLCCVKGEVLSLLALPAQKHTY